MSVKNDHRQCPHGAKGPPSATAAGGLDALLDALPPAVVAERRPVVRLAPNRAPAVAAVRFAVPRGRLEAELGPAAEGDEDLLRHAADRVAARLPAAILSAGGGGVPARAPVLLPLPLRPFPDPAPRPGLVGVLPPLAAAASAAGGGDGALAARRAGLAALGWRLGLGELDADALRFAEPAALLRSADLLLLRWSRGLAELEYPLRGADPQALVLAGCDGAEAVEWGRGAGLVLFCGPAAEAMLPPTAAGAAP